MIDLTFNSPYSNSFNKKALKNEKKNDYLFIFCGGDSGNLDFIKNEIKKYSLEKYFVILPLVTDLQLISLYLNTYIVAMPTTGGPTNLPLYESFFFQKSDLYQSILFFLRSLNKISVLKNK